MQTFFNTVVDPAAAVLIPAAVAYLLNVGVPFVTDKLLKSRASFLVKAAEGTIKGSGKGADKYAAVAAELADYAHKRLLYFIKDARIKYYVEAAVTELHAELPSALSNAQKQIESEQVPAQPATPTQADAQTAAVQTQTPEK